MRAREGSASGGSEPRLAPNLGRGKRQRARVALKRGGTGAQQRAVDGERGRRAHLRQSPHAAAAHNTDSGDTQLTRARGQLGVWRESAPFHPSRKFRFNRSSFRSIWTEMGRGRFQPT